MLQGKYSYVLTTHIDKGHVHNHLIFCAVDMVNHRKYNSNRQSYAYIRRTVTGCWNTVCRWYSPAGNKSWHAGYARWAKLQNLKQAAKTINFLTEHGIEQYAELESKVAEISAANDEAAASLKDVEHRLGNMAVLIKNLTTYKQLRPVVLEYRKAKDKAAFRREHESQLILYEAAAKAIKDTGITRLPDLAALKAEYRELDKQKARLYEQYGEVKRELKEYGIIKQNVDSILRVMPGKEQAQEL